MLWVCGVLHDDLQGSSRLERVLETIRPDRIFLEFNREGLYRAKHEHASVGRLPYQLRLEAARQNPDARPDTMAAYLFEKEFDAWVPFQWAENNHVPLDPLGETQLMRQHTEEVRKLRIPPQNSFLNNPRKYQKIVDAQYWKADDDWLSPQWTPTQTVRDEAMAARIPAVTNGLLIVGVAHMYGKHPHLGQFLKQDYRRFRLSSAQTNQQLAKALTEYSE